MSINIKIIQDVTESLPLALHILGPWCEPASGHAMWCDVSALDADAGMADYVGELAVDADTADDCWKGG